MCMVYPCTELEFIKLVQDNISIAGVIRGLQRAICGSSYALVRSEIKRMGLDTSHWKGQAHGTSGRKAAIPMESVLVENSPYSGGMARKKVIASGILGDACVRCGTQEWMGEPLSLHLDHVNGLRTDHRPENLRLLCPNCHSQTPTYCGRNKRRYPHGWRNTKMK